MVLQYGLTNVIHILMLFNCGRVAFSLVLVDILPTQQAWVTWGVENYCKILVPFNDRSAFAIFRCGMAPIRLETGRYENI